MNSTAQVAGHSPVARHPGSQVTPATLLLLSFVAVLLMDIIVQFFVHRVNKEKKKFQRPWMSDI